MLYNHKVGNIACYRPRHGLVIEFGVDSMLDIA